MNSVENMIQRKICRLLKPLIVSSLLLASGAGLGAPADEEERL